MSLSSATSNSLDEYSYSKSNEEQYIPNDAISLASSDHDARYRVGSRRLRVKNGINSKFDNLKLIANIVEDEIMNVLDGHDTRTVFDIFDRIFLRNKVKNYISFENRKHQYMLSTWNGIRSHQSSSMA